MTAHLRRLLTYSHDSYGLGHFRRSLTIAEHLLSRDEKLSVLAVTGSPRAHSFRLPHRYDYVKLPSASKDRAGRYVARELPVDIERLAGWRSALLRECTSRFEPDLVLVDHVPAGLGGELLPVLPELRRSGARILLGLRDIIDEPRRVRESWKRDGTLEVIRRHYDGVLHYGDARVFDPRREYAMPDDVAALVHEVGYVVRRADAPSADSPRRHDLGKGPVVLVTAGGGGDGHRLLRHYLESLRRSGSAPDYTSLLVTGPLMSQRKRTRLRELAADVPRVRVTDFVRDMPELLARVDAVACMGGYNTVAEVLAAGVPALIVPRVHPRREQWTRARALSRHGLVDVLHPEELARRTLACRMRKLPRRGRAAGRAIPRLDGLASIERVLSRATTSARPLSASGAVVEGP